MITEQSDDVAATPKQTFHMKSRSELFKGKIAQTPKNLQHPKTSSFANFDPE